MDNAVPPSSAAACTEGDAFCPPALKRAFWRMRHSVHTGKPEMPEREASLLSTPRWDARTRVTKVMTPRRQAQQCLLTAISCCHARLRV